jgi:hypothetical protein
VVDSGNALLPNQYEGGAATNGSVPWRLDVLVRCPTDNRARLPQRYTSTSDFGLWGKYKSAHIMSNIGSERLPYRMYTEVEDVEPS